jgi:hypothetical protein
MKASKFSDAPKAFTLKHGSDNVPLRCGSHATYKGP